jgi:hypothetical protein
MTKNYKPMIFISSPYSGDVASNTTKAQAYSRFAVDSGYLPIAPHLLFPQFMSEATERDEALHFDCVLLGKCEEVWVFGYEISQGMTLEIEKAKNWHKLIRYFDENCAEVTDA